jgi:hypothetical protein
MPGVLVNASSTAELLGIGVHHLHEGGLVAADFLGERHRGVVARLHDHADDQVLDRDLLADLDEHFRAFLLPGVLADGHRVGELDAAFLQCLEHAVGRHELRQARGLLARIGFERGEHAAAIVVDDDVAAP